MSGLKEKLDSIQDKAKQRTVKTQNIEYDLETLVNKLTKNIIKLNPDYQRKHRWGNDVSSRLIESLILNIPIPLIYISQDIDVDAEVGEEISRYSVIDGQQRLTAILGFFQNDYALEGLEVLSDLNGAKYSDLPPFLIRRLEERTIRCLRIDSTLDGQVKYDIFERLNSGSVKLEAQELRNATCRGPFKDLIKKLSKNSDFVVTAQLDPNGARVRKMEDEELVLRFFSLAYKDGYKEYKSGFKTFLTKNMEKFNEYSAEEINNMDIFFNKTFSLILKIFGETPFAKYRDESGNLSQMSKYNVAVFDSIVVPIASSLDREDIKAESFRKLFYDKDYFSTVEGSVNDTSKLNSRIMKGFEAIG